MGTLCVRICRGWQDTLNNIYRDGGWCCCGWWWWWCGPGALWRLFDIKTVSGNESQNLWIIICDILHQAAELHLAPAPPPLPLYEYQAMEQNKTSAASTKPPSSSLPCILFQNKTIMGPTFHYQITITFPNSIKRNFDNLKPLGGWVAAWCGRVKMLVWCRCNINIITRL